MHFLTKLFFTGFNKTFLQLVLSFIVSISR